MLIGLTGTYGSGKSAVARFFEECGAATLDADLIARQVVLAGCPALEEIRRQFGEQFITPEGELDRKQMADLVFPSPQKRRILNAIVHPHVIREMNRLVSILRDPDQTRQTPGLIVLNIPLLFEAGMADQVDRIVVVTINERERFRRVRRRDGLTEKQIVQRIAAQWPQREKLARADAVIDNSGDPQQTRQSVMCLCQEWAPAISQHSE
ncbi:dephospho-CoA kinase [bacterium]|nr:dephospho-CoA kinase [bacterium]